MNNWETKKRHRWEVAHLSRGGVSFNECLDCRMVRSVTAGFTCKYLHNGSWKIYAPPCDPEKLDQVPERRMT